jgi:hypothetical protein
VFGVLREATRIPEFAKWHLGIDDENDEDTRGRYKFPTANTSTRTSRTQRPPARIAVTPGEFEDVLSQPDREYAEVLA